MNREDAEGNNLFEGGFLGLDNIGPIDRSHLPVGGILEQADATGWMAFYAMAMASIAEILHRTGHRPGTDLVLKFVEHFAAIKQALDERGLWDETDGLYYDRLITASGDEVPLKVRSIVALLPALAMSVVDQGAIDLAMTVGKRFAALLAEQQMADSRQLADSGLLRGAAGSSAAAAEPGRARPAQAPAGRAVRRGRVPVAARLARAVGLASRPPLHDRAGGLPGQHRL